jgi:hypothetical protein
MADANPAEVQAVLNQIFDELDKIVQKRVAEALAGKTPSPSPAVSEDKLKFLAHMVYNLCMQTGMSVPEQLNKLKQ